MTTTMKGMEKCASPAQMQQPPQMQSNISELSLPFAEAVPNLAHINQVTKASASVTVDAPTPKLTVYTPIAYRAMSWKNGLGVTEEIYIHPPNRDFRKDEFMWRISLSTVNDSCSFSVFPGYDIAMMMLPPLDGTDKFGERPLTPAVLHHNDQETPMPFKPLCPYSYPGELPTTCKVKGQPMSHVTFIANRSKCQVTVSLEKICPHGLSDDGICDDNSEQFEKPRLHDNTFLNTSNEGAPTAVPTTKILLSAFTIVYVVAGAIRATLNGSPNAITATAGSTVVCERHEDSPPTDFAMVPVTTTKDGVFVGTGGFTAHQDATVLIIQVHLKPKIERNDSLVSSYPGSVRASTAHVHSTQSVRPSRGRAGSIIIYDDQPLRVLPKEFESQLSLDPNVGPVSSGSPLAGATANSSTSSSASSSLGMKYWESARHYRPPVFSARYQNESEVPPPVVRDCLKIEEFPEGKISTAWINMVKQGLSEWLRIPVIVARGVNPGPVVGITAAVHGNELNGVPCIHRVITDIDVHKLSGTVVAVPCVNVAGYLRFTREFSDGKDLNRLFPGQESGTASQVYAYNLMKKIINQFNYLIDMHTASFGRVNSYYVRSDLNDPVAAAMAKLQQPQIILHNSGQDGTLRSAAAAMGIKAITVEIGNPQLFQNQYVQWSYLGVMRILAYFNMFPASDILDLSMAEDEDVAKPGLISSETTHLHYGPPNTLICSKGFWIYTKTGGVLEVYPGVNTVIRKGDLIARIKNIFGNIVDEIYCPSHGITIGRSSNPVAMAGDRVLHLGVIKKENEVLAKEAKENY
ncbi:hypothetical protein DFJ73DRAFT_809382 [Zopfochytrium polystomum]|nr:hypothetical protein DFJ73DRAFT_809382 [Zopfochytrium polystomum]